ncbi:hypothetical protein GOC74_07100 [Halomicrobium mukohataei]|uniref:Uncharacterized protein n=1 Tax=Halomicrobium mukohataei TaxID=57705 RepID=A0A847UB27_9EURY|nr:hypothetical protein [Halomicrobium mukohataei]
MSDAFPAPEALTVLGVAAVVVGALLPWEVTAAGTTVGLGANGFVAVLAAFAVLATVAVMRGSATAGRVALAGGLVAALVAGHWIAFVAGLDGAGLGVVVSLLGGVVIAVGGGLRLVGGD